MWLMRITLITVFWWCFCYAESDICDIGGNGYDDCNEKHAECQTTSNSYECKCPPGMEFGDNALGECEVIDMCATGQSGYRMCESEMARCRSLPGGSYECYCEDGKIKIQNLCKDKSEASTESVPNFTSLVSLLLSSSTYSDPGINNTLSISHISSETDTSYTTATKKSTNHSIFTDFSKTLSSSTIHEPSTPKNDVSADLTTIAPDAGCLRNLCSKNASCVNVPGDFTCICKGEFIPEARLFEAKRHCLGNCTLPECIDMCKKMMCVLKKENEAASNATIYIQLIKSCSGWSRVSIIVCTTLTVLLILFISSTAYLLRRKVAKRNPSDEKQIVFTNRSKSSPLRPTNSVDNLAFKQSDCV